MCLKSFNTSFKVLIKIKPLLSYLALVKMHLHENMALCKRTPRFSYKFTILFSMFYF